MKKDQAIDTYLLLDNKGKFITDKYTLNFLKEKIYNVLENPDCKIKKITKKQTENIANFEKFIKVQLTQKSNEILLEISTLDHPGLLSKICESFDSCDLMVKDAKISTLGEEANDVFILVPISKKSKIKIDFNQIESKIREKISEYI